MQQYLRKSKRRVNLFGLCSCAAIAFLILLSCAGSSVVTARQTELLADTLQLKRDTINIIAVGDIMLGSAYPSKSGLPADDAKNSFKSVSALLKGDLVFGNLEGCFLNEGKSTKCKDTIGNSCFAFRMPERYASIYKDAGFNVLSVANNHVGDFGQKGRKRTTELLDSLQINYAGLLSKPYTIFEKDSIKYGFCAFSPNDHTVSINNLDSARALVSAVKKQVDIMIVSFHGGAEGSKFEHVTKADEIFYKENRGNVYAFAHAVIDAGADLVLGHGPHVARAVEVYKNKFIAYSMGNFCTYGMFNLNGPNGSAPLFNIKIDAKGDFLFAEVASVKQDKINRLQLDPLHTAFKKIAFLTRTDFPGNRLSFSDQRIQVKKN